MVFRGTILDESGNPLIGANVRTQFRVQNVGTITDFDGVFVIGDARADESWRISHVGYKDIYFNVPRNGGELVFKMEEKAIELDEVVVTPRGNNTSGSNTGSDVASGFQDVIDKFPTKPKAGFWDKLKQNPLAAVGLGALVVIVGGAVLSAVARKSDKMEAKRLAKT